MWPIITRIATRYAPYITLPFAAAIGFLGYHLEGLLSDKYTPPTAPVVEQREERLLEKMDNSAPKKKHKPLEVNLSPSLSS